MACYNKNFEIKVDENGYLRAIQKGSGSDDALGYCGCIIVGLVLILGLVYFILCKIIELIKFVYECICTFVNYMIELICAFINFIITCFWQFIDFCTINYIWIWLLLTLLTFITLAAIFWHRYRNSTSYSPYYTITDFEDFWHSQLCHSILNEHIL